MSQPTTIQIARAASDWSAIAGERLELECIGTTMYAFGSELGLLRLFYKMTVGRVQFSKNLGRWSYALVLAV